MTNNSPKEFIRQTIELAKATEQDEVPVAALIVCDGVILAEAVNSREKDQDIFGHAEINVLKQAQKKLGSWNLSKCQIYVSLEPCVMCAGAIVQAHISEVYFAAYDYKFGACGSKFMVFPQSTKIEGGILEQEAKEILKSFFEKKR
jgi:tRNA(adenine34) deaminase